MKYIVVYDACVFYPAPVRDILMELAQPGNDLFQAKWTRQIEAEWIRSLAEDRPDISIEKLHEIARHMIVAVPDCIVDNYQDLVASLHLPDSGDLHVFAAAIRCKAQAIITFNLKDFPVASLADYDIEPIHPDIFLINQFDLSQGKVLDAVKNIRLRLKKPPVTAARYIDNLASLGLTAFSNMLREFEHLI